MGRVSRRRVLAALAGASALGLLGCGEQPVGPAPSTLYLVGDSITAPDSLVPSTNPTSWVAHLDPRLTVVGGWAEPGATTETMAAGVDRSDAHTLVILAGANEAGRLPFETTAYHLETIVQRVRAPRVVVATLPPRDPQPQWHVQFNQNLGLLARDKGWHLCDPMGGVRSSLLWAPGMTDDGLHPTATGATAIGRALSECLLGLP